MYLAHHTTRTKTLGSFKVHRRKNYPTPTWVWNNDEMKRHTCKQKAKQAGPVLQLCTRPVWCCFGSVWSFFNLCFIVACWFIKAPSDAQIITHPHSPGITGHGFDISSFVLQAATIHLSVFIWQSDWYDWLQTAAECIALMTLLTEDD